MLVFWIRIVILVEDIQMGISKPLQEMVLSSSDDESYGNNSAYSKNQNDGSFNNLDTFNDDDEEEDDEEDEDEDDMI